MSRCLALIALLLAVSSAQAQKAEEMGTPEQRAACSHDVGRYCKTNRRRAVRLPRLPAEEPEKLRPRA
jgi:hypothetical protein